MIARWSLTGRVVLITGGSGGLGREVARRLAASGANVALIDRDAAGVESAAAELGHMAAGWQADVCDMTQLDRAARQVHDHFGRIDVVVANAGINAFGPVATLDPATFDRVIDVNLNGAWRTIRAALPFVTERKGYVLAVSSMAAFVHSPLQAHYAASKAGVKALVDSLRVELRGTGVRVGSIHPTFFDTQMMRDTLADPAGGVVWGGNKRGAWQLTPVDLVARETVRAIERRSNQVVVPRRLLPTALMPGLVRPVTDRLIKSKDLRRAVESADTSGWADQSAARRIGV